jgi:uncharacterized protein (TIGR00369 family)
MEIQALAKQVAQAQPFTRYLGAELLEVQPKAVVFALEVRPEFYQHLGMVHGGVIAALLDNALTFAGGTVLGAEVLTVEFKVNFLRPTRGQRLKARAQVIHAGKRLAVVQGEVISEEDGESYLVALGQGTVSKV